MAIMIPPEPKFRSDGEKRLFHIFARLPDDYIVYYEPTIQGKRPDFVVIAPDLGILVAEVKGWYAKHIEKASKLEVTVQDPREPTSKIEEHPLIQAKNYMLNLLNYAQRHGCARSLLDTEGRYKGKFTFPFGHFAVMSKITKNTLTEHLEELPVIFPAETVALKEQLDEWETMDADGIREVIAGFFSPTWEFPPLDERRVKLLQYIINPEFLIEVREEASAERAADIALLDIKQQAFAAAIGEGHRTIYGVAGSGKTLILLARAKLLSQRDKDAKILFLCSNVALAAWIRSKIDAEDYANIQVIHFHGLARRAGVYSGDYKNIGNLFLEKLEQDGNKLAHSFDAILIDEAQDFEPSWFKCAVALLKDPENGDLVIVGDGNQRLYGTKSPSWKELGIKAQGRTYHSKFNLDRNYRNSREIAGLSKVFSTPASDDTNGIRSPGIDLENCDRSTGIPPVLHSADSLNAEINVVCKVVEGLLQGDWFGQKVEPLLPQEIAVLYPRNKSILPTLIESLKAIPNADPVSLSEPKSNRERIAEPGVKIQTIHSSKGLQYPAVLILMAGLLPFEEFDEDDERRILYVGLTRAEDYLLITHSQHSKFVEEAAEHLSLQ